MRRAGPTRWLAAGMLLAASAPIGSRAATLSISVQNVHSARGHVRIGVCERSEFLSEHCTYHAIVSSRSGTVTTTIPDVGPGIYAVTAYQDETDAGHLRRGLFGIPKDGVGFSRDPASIMGPPSFDRCALQIGTAAAAITVTLHYY